MVTNYKFDAGKSGIFWTDARPWLIQAMARIGVNDE